MRKLREMIFRWRLVQSSSELEGHPAEEEGVLEGVNGGDGDA